MLFDEEEKEIEVEKKSESKYATVIPLRNFRIVHNDVDLSLIEGEVIEVDRMFIPNLKTEKVIK